MPAFFSYKNVLRFFFPAYLIAGILLFTDYGMSWDEELNRIGTALPEYNFAFHGDKEGLINSSEKYHGPAFELLLISAEQISGFTDTRSIYFLRHFITFFFFWLSSLFLFLLSMRVFRNDRTALFCLLMYVLSPRIFGESFYNSKDLSFLSLFTISLYTLHQFLEKKNFLSGFFHALVTGFMIDIRITGFLVPLVTIIIYLADFITSEKRNLLWKKWLLTLIIYQVLLFGFIILFWPVLWIDPFFHISEALKQMSDYPWRGQMVFAGRIIWPQTMPWYYLPLWILITVPLLYSILFFAGVIGITGFLIKLGRAIYEERKFHLIFLSLAVIPVIAVIVLQSVIYDGWRHLYFIYGPFVMVAAYGTEYFYKKFLHGIWIRRLFTAIITLQFLTVILILAVDHPHQHVYFNLTARMLYKPVTLNFDADYWGLSYRKGFEEILARDTSSRVHVRVENDPGVYNLQMLTPEQRDRISIHGDLFESDYWLAEFRGRKTDPQKVNATLLFQVKNSSGTLLSVYKGFRKSTQHRVIFRKELDFEDTLSHHNKTEHISFGGKYSQELTADAATGESITYIVDSIPQDEIEEVEMEAMVYTDELAPQVIFALSVMRNDSMVFWHTSSFQNSIKSNDWTRIEWNITFPEMTVLKGDKVSAYVWNIDKTQMFVDDFKLSVSRHKADKSIVYFPE